MITTSVSAANVVWRDLRGDIHHHRIGSPVAYWHYRNADGAPFCTVARFDTPDGKEVLPFHANGAGIVWKLPGGKRPLYRISDLLNGGKRVLVVEGEKTAEAARRLFPGWAVTTSQGGSSAAEKSDWSPVKGKQVTIWPDADDAGEKYWRAVARLCHEADAESVHVVEVPTTAPKAWDLADQIRDGWRIDEMLDNAVEHRSDAVATASAWRDLAMTGAALAGAEFPELEEIVAGLIVPGFTLLQGKPKVGKSLLVMEMVLSAGMGRHAMGHFRCKQVPAVAFMMEDPYRRLKDRQRAICEGRGPPDNLYWFDVTMQKHFNGDALGFIDSFVEDTGARIVVLHTFETIRRHLKLPKETGRTYGDDYAAGKLLQEWAQGRDVALIVLHHDRKADGDLIDRVSGTLGIAGAADQIIGMTSKIEGAHKRWFVETRGRDLPPREFEIALSGSRWAFVGEKNDDIVNPLEADVREMAAAGKSQREIAKVTGVPRSTIQDWLKR
jgi:hypothetical protein